MSRARGLHEAMAGLDILSICAQTPYYQDRMFNILEVVRNRRRGGPLDVFRIELCRAKDEAKTLATRPRLISGGGDGTGSFALFVLFLALKADPARESDGLADTGNGFIWTDEDSEGLTAAKPHMSSDRQVSWWQAGSGAPPSVGALRSPATSISRFARFAEIQFEDCQKIGGPRCQQLRKTAPRPRHAIVWRQPGPLAHRYVMTLASCRCSCVERH